MLDITVCRSILEKCMDIDTFFTSSDSVKVANRIRQHRMVVSSKLLEYYEEYFNSKSPEYKYWYQSLVEKVLYSQERAVFAEEKNVKINFIKNAEYLNELLNVCYNSADRLVVSDDPKIDDSILKKYKIESIKTKDILDKGANNTFTKFTMPIHMKNIENDEKSIDIAEWIGRFLKNQKYIVIFDNFIATKDNIRNLRKYILKFIEQGADVIIYTFEIENVNKQNIIDEFTSKYYSKWNIEIYLIKRKRDQHGRIILTEKHTIQLDRGISLFGVDGRTYQCIINIDSNEDVERYSFKEDAEKIV